jgi:hypothetical protein
MPIIFDNVNNPAQPIAGVYRWYFKVGARKLTLYVGKASGPRKSLFKRASTLFRGISEASQNHTSAINTNVLVGQAIAYVVKTYGECHWEHISNNPDEEEMLVGKHRPILQSGLNIFSRDISLLQKKIEASVEDTQIGEVAEP